MSSLYKTLQELGDSIAAATAEAPDEYPDWSSWTYESHMADIKCLWAEVRPRIRRDLDRVELVDTKLQEMFAAFDAGEKDEGRKAAWDIYNLDVSKLR